MVWRSNIRAQKQETDVKMARARERNDPYKSAVITASFHWWICWPFLHLDDCTLFISPVQFIEFCDGIINVINQLQVLEKWMICQISLGTERVDEDRSKMLAAADVNLSSPHTQQGLWMHARLLLMFAC